MRVTIHLLQDLPAHHSAVHKIGAVSPAGHTTHLDKGEFLAGVAARSLPDVTPIDSAAFPSRRPEIQAVSPVSHTTRITSRKT
jgi:hypothetical protein